MSAPNDGLQLATYTTAPLDPFTLLVTLYLPCNLDAQYQLYAKVPGWWHAKGGRPNLNKWLRQAGHFAKVCGCPPSPAHPACPHGPRIHVRWRIQAVVSSFSNDPGVRGWRAHLPWIERGQSIRDLADVKQGRAPSLVMYEIDPAAMDLPFVAIPQDAADRLFDMQLAKEQEAQQFVQQAAANVSEWAVEQQGRPSGSRQIAVAGSQSRQSMDPNAAAFVPSWDRGGDRSGT